MMTQKADDSPAVAAALPCNGTDALLQVKYTITEAERKSTRSFSPAVSSGRFTPFLLSTGSPWYKFNPKYKEFRDLTDYEACLPRDSCSEVVVGGLPTDG